MLSRIQEKRASIRFQKGKKGKKPKKAKEGKNQKFNKAKKKKKMDPKALAAATPLPVLGPRGLVVDNPVGALHVVRETGIKKPIKRRPAIPPPLFGQQNQDGTVFRDVYMVNYETNEEAIYQGGFAELVGRAGAAFERVLARPPSRFELAGRTVWNWPKPDHFLFLSGACTHVRRPWMIGLPKSCPSGQ